MITVKTKTGEMLRQVLLRRATEHGYTEDVFWIDNKLAHQGKRLLSEDDGFVWTVVETYNAKAFEDVDKLRVAWKIWSDVLDGH